MFGGHSVYLGTVYNVHSTVFSTGSKEQKEDITDVVRPTT